MMRAMKIRKRKYCTKYSDLESEKKRKRKVILNIFKTPFTSSGKKLKIEVHRT